MAAKKAKSVIVKSVAKEIAKSKGLRFPDDAVEALNKVVVNLIECAAARAKKNNRKTLRDYDF